MPAATPPQASTSRPRWPAGWRVLVVNSDADAAELMVELLEIEGHECASAASAGAALDKAREARFDVVLTGLQLPDGDGPGLALALRQAQPWLVWVAVLSGRDAATVRSLPGAAAVDQVLETPIDIDHLLGMLARLDAPDLH